MTPLLNAWKVAALLAGVAAFNLREELAALDQSVLVKILLVLGLLVVGALFGLGYGALAWRRMQYGIGPDSIFLHSGVLWRQQRHLRLDRIQAIDVTQPLLARLFGFASLKIESAGGGESNLTLSYLTDREAQRLRNEILARAAGVEFDDEPAGSGTPFVPAAPEVALLNLSPGRLVGSLLLTEALIFGLLVVVGVSVAGVVLDLPVAMGVIVPWLFLVGGLIWGRFTGEFAFRIGTSADGVRLRHGLLEAKTRTVPPGRVQAVSISQAPLWRGRDWWRIKVNIAGYGVGGEDGVEPATAVLYPVATSREVAQVLPLVLPDLGTERPLEVLIAGMTGRGQGEGFVTSPRRMRRFDPITWEFTGLRVTDTAVMFRVGRWWRSLTLVPHERTQSMALKQGPLERRFDVASVELHSTPGPVTPVLDHVDVGVARSFLVEQADRARQARKRAAPARWMQHRKDARVNVPEPELLRAHYGGVLPSRRAAS
ncbi:MAG: PH domain-containing protein [Beutenbergiaceae bacterium]